MKKTSEGKTSFIYIFTCLSLLCTMVLTSCSLIFGDSESSAKETQLKETELSLRVRETLLAQQSLQETPETQQSSQNTPEAQQTPTEDIEATNEAEAQLTWGAINAGGTATQEAASQVLVTTEVPQVSTQPAGSMNATLQQLYDEGVISKTSGDYYSLQDFDESVAQIDYLFTYPRDYEAENFVITSNVQWDSASDTANWPTSGCGFYYANDNPDEFTLGATSLRLDGYGVVQQWVKGDGKYLAKKKASSIDVPEGAADLMLVVFDKRVTLYVNGSRVVSAYDGLVKLGTLGFTISSGTNAGFGTRCQMTDVNLWIFD